MDILLAIAVTQLNERRLPDPRPAPPVPENLPILLRLAAAGFALTLCLALLSAGGP